MLLLSLAGRLPLHASALALSQAAAQEPAAKALGVLRLLVRAGLVFGGERRCPMLLRTDGEGKLPLHLCLQAGALRNSLSRARSGRCLPPRKDIFVR